MAQYRVGVTVFSNHLGPEQVDALTGYLRDETGNGTAQEHEDRDIVRLSFLLEADDYDGAQVEAERLVDRAAKRLEWEAWPRAVGAVRVATPPVAP